ncbi:hypothetical protein BVC80_209g13 [Macleaya cordata]|uniref:RING-type domain-containing protein n=1 Tax=Macleaya cordata TaxID=56857 RepID=A0A200QCU3_MACCD|nr:hypothetical protein BVC80_209g13 [Macleaya cordata]
MGNTQQKLNKPPRPSSYSDDEDEDDKNSNKLEEEGKINNDNSSSSSSRFFTCEICTDDVPLNQKFKNNNSKQLWMMKKRIRIRRRRKRRRCPDDGHPFCTDCVARYIQVKVDEDNTSQIKCPDINCDNLLDPLSCRSILPSAVFVRWCDLLCEYTVLARFPHNNNNNNRAYCPFPHCSELVLNECSRPVSHWRNWSPIWRRNNNNKITTRSRSSKCPNCRNLFCFHCMVPWEESHQCSTTDEMMIISKKKRERNNHALFLKMVERNKWKRCPTCNHYVERSHGCSLIECRSLLPPPPPKNFLLI